MCGGPSLWGSTPTHRTSMAARCAPKQKLLQDPAQVLDSSYPLAQLLVCWIKSGSCCLGVWTPNKARPSRAPAVVPGVGSLPASPHSTPVEEPVG